MATTYIKDGGTWKAVDELHAKSGGSWYEAQSAYRNVSGTWTKFYDKAAVTTTTSAPTTTTSTTTTTTTTTTAEPAPCVSHLTASGFSNNDLNGPWYKQGSPVNGKYAYSNSSANRFMYWEPSNSRWEIRTNISPPGTLIAYSTGGAGHTGGCPYPATWTLSGSSAGGTTTSTTTTTTTTTSTTTTSDPGW